MDKKLTISVSRRSLKIALILAVVLTVLAPVAVIAAGGTFTDDDTSIFEGDIEWMAANGITAGCNPPTNDNYCPNDAVTRGQMAAFMKRLATNKVVDAATAVTAEDADTVGGYAPDSLVRATGAHIGSGFLTFGTAVGVNSTTSFATVTINAPVAGALIINGSLNLYCQGGLFPSCNQSDGNTYANVDGTQYARQYYAVDGGDALANAAAWNSSNSAYVPVAAGDHTVAIDVNNSSGSGGSTYVWSGGMNVTFVPFAGDGSEPAVAPTVALSGIEAGQN